MHEKFHHYRHDTEPTRFDAVLHNLERDLDRIPNKISAITKCIVTDANNKTAVGYAFCSGKDQFCKKLGRNISRGRAIKILKSE